MRTSFLAAVAIVAIFTFVSSSSAQSQWQLVEPEGGGFSVSMPGTPTVESETKPSDLGPYTSKLFTVTAGNVIYLVGYVDYQPSVRLNVQGELDATRDKFLKAVSGTLVAEKKITLGGHSGIEFTADIGTTHFVTSKVYVVGQRPYQILAVTRKGADQTDANKFLSSFKLSKK